MLTAGSRDYTHLTVNQISRQCGQTFVLPVCPAKFDSCVLAFDKTAFFEPNAERGEYLRCISRRPHAQETYHRHALGLLRTHRNFLCRCSATEKRDELASPHVRPQS